MNGLTSLSGGCTQCVLSDENKNNVNITLACLFLSILVSWKNVSTQLLLKNFEFWIIICQLHWGDVRKAQEKRQSSNFMLDQASHEVGGLQIDIGDLCLTRRWPTWSSSLLSRYMGPFSVILWVLEISHFCPNMPLGVVDNGKTGNLENRRVSVHCAVRSIAMHIFVFCSFEQHGQCSCRSLQANKMQERIIVFQCTLRNGNSTQPIMPLLQSPLKVAKL